MYIKRLRKAGLMDIIWIVFTNGRAISRIGPAGIECSTGNTSTT
jgi:hypothetical protein